MAYTQRAPNSVAALATVAALSATVALLAIMVGAMFWFWAAGFIFVAAGLAAILVASRMPSSASQGTYLHQSSEEKRWQANSVRSKEDQPIEGAMPPPPNQPEGRQPPTP